MILSLSVFAKTDYYEKGSNINLKYPCWTSNKTMCSDISVCNITILTPESLTLINNQEMSNNGSYHNYTLSSSQTQVEGKYTGVIYCVDNGDYGFGNEYFYILDDNIKFSNTQKIDYRIVIFIISLSFVLLILYIFTKNIVLGWTVSGINIIVSILTWIYGIIIPITINENFSAFYAVDSVLTRGVGIILVVFSIWLMIHASFQKAEENNADISYGETF